MARGNKKRGNQCRRRAAIRQKMAETGQSYTACLLRGEAAGHGGQAQTRPAKLGDSRGHRGGGPPWPVPHRA